MSRFKFQALFLFTLFTLAVMVTPAYSTTITSYSDSASWTAATSGVTTDDFGGLAPAGSLTMYPGGIFQNGVEFIGISGSTGVGDTALSFFSSFANFGTGDAGFVTGTTGVAITLTAPVTAFGINLFSASPAGATYTVSTLSTPFTVPTASTTPPTFFGVTSDTPFSTVNLTVPSGTTYAFFDNFSFGTAQAGTQDTGQVPEAGTFFLIGTGLIGFAAFRAKTRQPR